MQELLQKFTEIWQTTLAEIVQTMQKFIADDPIISVVVLIIFIIGGIAGFYFWVTVQTPLPCLGYFLP